MFEIICLGRMDFMMAVLNGLAMLTADDGPAGYGGLIALGLLIGVVLALVKSIVTQRLELQWILVGWLLFMGLFAPKVTVTVEDIYSGETNTVANVPLGPAAIGSITSTVGITLAEAFETVFAYPSMTSAGYMDTLDLINSMRHVDFGSANDGEAASTVPEIDLQRTLREYLVKCTMKSISMGLPGIGPTWAVLRESPDLVADIEVNSNIWPTTVYLNAAFPTGQSMGCADAYAQISDFINRRFYPAWQTYIRAQLGLPDTEDAEAQMQEALNAIFGMGASAREYMLNSLIKREIDLADVAHHASGGNDAGVLMRVQAMEQRRVQWAAEHSMWSEMARPAISFIEGFFYACSPIMGFVFCLGAPGITIFGRYLLLAVWIQLWMPILAVSNLYITIAASNDLQRISAAGTNLVSMTGLESVWTETASWLAFGANMVAATPLLTLILISGSYFAFTRLTDRLSGADHINERIAAPDLMQPAPFASVGATGQQAASYVQDAAHGLRHYGTENWAGNLSVSSSLSAAVQSRQSHVVDSVQRLMRDTTSGVDLSHREQLDKFLSSGTGQSTRTSNSEVDSVLRSMAIDVVGSADRYAQLGTADQSTIQAGLALGLKGLGSGADAARTTQNLQNATEGEKKSWARAIVQKVQGNQSTSVDYARALVSDDQKGTHSQILRGLGVQDSQRWSEALSDTATAMKGYDEVKGVQDAAGQRWDVSALIVGNQLAEHGQGVGKQLYQLATGHYNVGDRVNSIQGLLVRHGGVDPEVATYAASAKALMEHSPEAAVHVAKILSESLGAPRVSVGNPAANAGIESEVEGRTKEVGTLQEDVKRHLIAVPDSAGNLRATADAAAKEAQQALQKSESLAITPETIRESYEKGRKENREVLASQSKELNATSNQMEAEIIESSFSETRSPARALNEQSWSQPLTKAAGPIATALEEGGKRYRSTYDETFAKTGDLVESAKAAIKAGLDGLGSGVSEFDKKTYREAHDGAIAAGIPAEGAHFYAQAHMLTFKPLVVRAALEGSEAFRRERQEAEHVVGEQGVTALQFAATGNDIARDRYLSQAAALARAKNSATTSPDESHP